MSFWDIAEKVLDTGISIYNNYQNQQNQNSQQMLDYISSIKNYAPKLLDNYIYGASLKSIVNENGVYAINDPSIEFQLARDEYYFCGNSWIQLFYFINNSLGQIKLIHQWNDDCYSNTIKKIGNSCPLIYIESNQSYVDYIESLISTEGELGNNYIDAIVEIEKEGLQNDKLIIYYCDGWALEYLFNSDKDFFDKINNKDALLFNLPNNARLIQVIVDNEDIVIDFINPLLLKNASF